MARQRARLVREREDAVAQADLAKLASQIATLVSQKNDKETERDVYANDIEAQKALVAVTQENLTMVESMASVGYNSESKLLEMKAHLEGQKVTLTGYQGSLESAKAAIVVAQENIAKTRDVFAAEVTRMAAENDQTITVLTESLAEADQTLEYMTLRAPAAGIVHASEVTTVGQVLKPRQQLMQIVPTDSQLEIAANIPNSDIGFIRKGDPVMIKLDAFTYSTYGSIDGTVVDIAKNFFVSSGKVAFAVVVARWRLSNDLGLANDEHNAISNHHSPCAFDDAHPRRGDPASSGDDRQSGDPHGTASRNRLYPLAARRAVLYRRARTPLS